MADARPNSRHPTLNSIKSLVRDRFPRVFAVLRRIYRFPSDYWKPLSGSARAILECFCAENAASPIRFVQIGAHNGTDEFGELRRRYGWVGVMVEPQPQRRRNSANSSVPLWA